MTKKFFTQIEFGLFLGVTIFRGHKTTTHFWDKNKLCLVVTLVLTVPKKYGLFYYLYILGASIILPW